MQRTRAQRAAGSTHANRYSTGNSLAAIGCGVANASGCTATDSVVHLGQEGFAEGVDGFVEGRQQGDKELGAVVAYGPDGGWPNDPYAPGEPRYQTLRALLSGENTPEQVLENLQGSGLRGMDGWGFPTGKKLDLVRNAGGSGKYAT